VLGPIFYNEQEDLLAERARSVGFTWTVLRPDVVIGFSTGSPMNLLTSERAADEIFNVLNGDQFRWEHLWPDIAQAFDMAVAAPLPMSLQEQMADKRPAWDALVRRHQLRPIAYDEITAWAFADGVWNSGFDMVQSTIKIRQAGFADCVDSHESLVAHLIRLRERRFVP
jgi:hypothetical protein